MLKSDDCTTSFIGSSKNIPSEGLIASQEHFDSLSVAPSQESAQSSEAVDECLKIPAVQFDSSLQFSNDETKAKHDSLHEFLEESLTADKARLYAQTFDSPLLDFLVQNDKEFDGLDMGSPDNTYIQMFTSVRSFNYFWSTVDASAVDSPSLLAVKEKYADIFDGFHALCIMEHSEREVAWSHYVVKARRLKEGADDLEFILGRTKRNYLNGLMRGIKLYQGHVGLPHDWSWAKDAQYARLNRVLDNSVLKTETTFTPQQLRGKNYADFMSEPQVFALKEFMVTHADSQAYFADKVRVWMHDLIQDIIIFGCPRARGEVAAILIKSITMINSTTMQFQQLGRFKSLKVNANKVASYKPPRFIFSPRAVSIFRKLKSHRPDLGVELGDQRLFLRPKDGVSESDKIWFQKRVMGEHFVGEAVSKYVGLMRAASHPLFREEQKFTNSSLRKYHSDTLSDAGAPVEVIQESLGHNTKSYTPGTSDTQKGIQAAKIISGQRSTWKPTKSVSRSKSARKAASATRKLTVESDEDAPVSKLLPKNKSSKSAKRKKKSSASKQKKLSFPKSDDEDDTPIATLFPKFAAKKSSKNGDSVPQILIPKDGTYRKLTIKIGEVEIKLG